MNAILWITAAAALTFVQPTPASAAQRGPEAIIYRFPGVRDDGQGSFMGIPTVFHCTNFSGVTENLRFVTRNRDAQLLGNTAITVNHLETGTVATHQPPDIAITETLATGPVSGGSTAVAATSTNIVCTAFVMKEGNAVTLHGIRLNPVPGSQE